MQQKYSHYLASKLFYYAPEDSQKTFFRSQVSGSLAKLLQHSFASEVVEYIYTQSSDSEKRELSFSLYENYFLLLKEMTANIVAEAKKNKTKAHVSLKDCLAQKPQLAQGILEKIEPVV
jgi:hypothetical protein